MGGSCLPKWNNRMVGSGIFNDNFITYSHTDPCTDADPNTGSDANPDTGSDADTDAHADAHSHAHADSHTVPHTNADADPHPEAVSQAHANPDPDPDARSAAEGSFDAPDTGPAELSQRGSRLSRHA